MRGVSLVSLVAVAACSTGGARTTTQAERVDVRRTVEHVIGRLPTAFVDLHSTPARDVFRTLDVALPKYADEAVRVGTSTGESLSLTPLGVRHAAFRNDHGVVIANDVAPHVDALWSAESTRTELYYVLRDEHAPRAFRFALDGDNVAVESEGTIRVGGLRIPRPFAVDAQGVRRDAGMRLVSRELVLELDATGLVFPIVLDPGVETATWTKIGGNPRFPREQFAAAEAAGKLVMFGGFKRSPLTYFGDTWELTGTTWTKKLPALSPEPRSDAYMAPLGGNIYLFGGNDGTKRFNDTWRWDGVNWTKLSTATPPSMRWGAGFGTTGSELVLFGGMTDPFTSPLLTETWRFNGTSWSQYIGAQPPARSSPWVIGRITGGLVLSGGYDGSGAVRDTWVWNGGWTKKTSTAESGGLTDGAKAYSVYSDLTMADYAKAWVFDGGTSWTYVPTAIGGAMPGMQVTAWTARPGETATWAFTKPRGPGLWSVQKFSSATWTTVVDESVVPSGVLADNGGELAILEGNDGRPNLLQRWARVGSTWTSTALPVLDARPSAAAFVGGKWFAWLCTGLRRLDGSVWSNLGSPSCSGSAPRRADGMAVTPSGHVLFAHGQAYLGSSITSIATHGPLALFKSEVHALEPSGSLWKWTGSDWTAVSASTTPAATELVAASGNRLVALGKFGTNYDQLAIWNGTSWRSLRTTGGPPVVHSFMSVGSRFYAYAFGDAGSTFAAAVQDAGAELWSLDIGYDNGTPCTLSSDCTSGFCTDGNCCDAASCGSGRSCATTTVKGSCRKVDGQLCATATECGSGLCEGGTCCKTSCTTSTHTCSAPGKEGTCVKRDGQPAAAGTECASGIVADGVCCNTTCIGLCRSCRATHTGKAEGVCDNVAEGTDPAGECPNPTDVNSCGPDGFCNGAGACRTLAPTTKPCGTTTCAGGTLSGPSCNGSGACIVGTKDCGDYQCAADGATCRTTCATAADCKGTGLRCDSAGKCVALSSNGKTCTAAAECVSNNCIDGVCCNNTCDGQCQACNVAGSEGTCSAVKGAPVGGRAMCNGATPCAGTCDGVAAGCTYPSFGTDCGTSCTDGKFVDKKCDNKGACVAKDPISCNNYLCATTGCKESCSSPSDCASADFDCKDGKCVPQSVARCADDGVRIEEGGVVTGNCAPWRCKGGKCLNVCTDSLLDCVPGHVCGGDGKCTPAAQPTEDDGGCGYGRGAARGMSTLMALACVAALLRRRRHPATH